MYNIPADLPVSGITRFQFRTETPILLIGFKCLTRTYEVGYKCGGHDFGVVFLMVFK